MREAVFIPCGSPADLPPIDDLARRVTRERHVVLTFPIRGVAEAGGFDAGALVGRLSCDLPEDVVAFDAGGRAGERWVTFKRVIPTAMVLENESAIYTGARGFRDAATRGMHALAAKLGLPVDAFGDPLIRMTLGDRDGGWVDAEWAYSFHGFECRLANRATGQVLEVELGFGTEFGVLDPYFFHKFLATTPAFAPVAALFHDSFHDPLRAIEVLGRRGKLRRVVRPLTGCEGWLAAD